MSAGFTPGPWVVNPLVAQVDCAVMSAQGGLLPVCRMLWPTDERSEDETEASAHLIAAAPELYEAARLAMEYDALLRTYKGPFKVLCDGDDVLLDEAYDRWITASKAALAKARGEQVPE